VVTTADSGTSRSSPGVLSGKGIDVRSPITLLFGFGRAEVGRPTLPSPNRVTRRDSSELLRRIHGGPLEFFGTTTGTYRAVRRLLLRQECGRAAQGKAKRSFGAGRRTPPPGKADWSFWTGRLNPLGDAAACFGMPKRTPRTTKPFFGMAEESNRAARSSALRHTRPSRPRATRTNLRAGQRDPSGAAMWSFGTATMYPLGSRVKHHRLAFGRPVETRKSRSHLFGDEAATGGTKPPPVWRKVFASSEAQAERRGRDLSRSRSGCQRRGYSDG
jgi:hypothetical protein